MSTYVLYFGGYKATLLNIKAWKASAESQKNSVKFEGYPYPENTSWDGGDAVTAFTNSHDLAGAIKKIETSDCDVIYIVGHSSGCAIANKVDAGLKDHKKITLVALDGYSPSDAQLARPSTQVWVAESATGKSMHFADYQDRIKAYNRTAKDKIQAKVFKASNDASTKLALHFSLVNVSSSDALVKVIPDGYKDCKTNLCWMV